MNRLIIICFIVNILIGCDESTHTVSTSWIIEEFYINDIQSKNKLKISSLRSNPEIVFQDQKTVLLPKLTWITLSPPYYPNYWEFKRDGLEGQVVITDNNQKYFSGTYDIEIIERTRPRLIRLYSDSLEFLLREEQGFSINRTVIPH